MAGSKTFLPTLKKILHHACVYITRHRDTIASLLPSDAVAALDTLVTACNIIVAAIDALEPPGG